MMLVWKTVHLCLTKTTTFHDLLVFFGDPDCEVHVVETFHEQTDDELTEKEQMMKGSDIGIQAKKAKLLYELERFTSPNGESIESYYHLFSKLMNAFKRKKHFLEKIASNLKFLNNLQPEWRRHVTIVHQTKDLHKVDYTQLYDFLKYNQAETGNGNVEAAQAKGNGNGNNGNQIRCYNCKVLGHLARNCTARPRKRDAAYL
uniref:CCHC-type domain-containing protein n=1 Tax=Tanacetum cinerariifolium TaxID=118510 RepID=A0A6L2MH82_TANCI|nr:hypothetical protein [Tanacetum cinerariifolium]